MRLALAKLEGRTMVDREDDTPRGLLLVSQPGELRATPEEMFRALPASYKGLTTLPVDLDVVELARNATRTRDFSPAHKALKEKFQALLVPLRAQHPDYRLVYLGSSPIPLAVQLGFWLETWQRIEVIPHHHTKRAWGWSHHAGESPARLAETHLPDYRDRTAGEAIIRVSTSHVVDPHATREAVPDPLLEIDIRLEHPGEDAFTSFEEMLAVAHEFRRALDVIGDHFPGIQRVHLFASVQPGIALLLGAQISRTMHPCVQTYQYERHANDGPYHVPAILVNGPDRPPPPALGDEDLARAKRDREHLQVDLDRVKGLAQRSLRSPMTSWVAGALSRCEGHPAFCGIWQHLLPLHETPLPATSVDVATRQVEDSFRLNVEKAWQLDDHWLARLAKRIPEEKERQRALRQLVLHEAVHRGRQALTRTSSQAIGRFPKVLEEMDYHADVWAMLYEYALTELASGTDVADPARFFRKLIRSATETMWAFDDDGTALSRIQIRRLNRYLLWYWQYLHLSRETGRGDSMSLDKALEILAEKPVLELAGPLVLAREERVFFELDDRRMSVPELAVYHNGALYRHGSRHDFSIPELLEGVRQRDGERILGALRAAFEQTVRA